MLWFWNIIQSSINNEGSAFNLNDRYCNVCPSDRFVRTTIITDAEIASLKECRDVYFYPSPSEPLCDHLVPYLRIFCDVFYGSVGTYFIIAPNVMMNNGFGKTWQGGVVA